MTPKCKPWRHKARCHYPVSNITDWRTSEVYALLNKGATDNKAKY